MSLYTKNTFCVLSGNQIQDSYHWNRIGQKAYTLLIAYADTYNSDLNSVAWLAANLIGALSI